MQNWEERWERLVEGVDEPTQGSFDLGNGYEFKWMKNGRDDEVYGMLVKDGGRMVPNTSGWWRTKDPEAAFKMARDLLSDNMESAENFPHFRQEVLNEEVVSLDTVDEHTAIESYLGQAIETACMMAFNTFKTEHETNEYESPVKFNEEYSLQELADEARNTIDYHLNEDLYAIAEKVYREMSGYDET